MTRTFAHLDRSDLAARLHAVEKVEESWAELAKDKRSQANDLRARASGQTSKGNRGLAATLIESANLHDNSARQAESCRVAICGALGSTRETCDHKEGWVGRP